MSRKEIRPHACTCGSTWFREHQFVELPELLSSDILDYSGDLEYRVVNPFWALVCTCGELVPDLRQNQRGPHARRSVKRFENNLRQVQGRSLAHVMAIFKQQVAVERAQLPNLRQRVAKLNRAVGRIIARPQVEAGKRNSRGQNWQAPRRRSANQGECKGRDTLVLELQKQGLTFRKARAAVRAFVEAMREGLRQDKWLETPIGNFIVRSRSHPPDKPLERKRLGRKQSLYKQRAIVFEPNRILFEGNAKGRKVTK
jgi:hypothetical protein